MWWAVICIQLTMSGLAIFFIVCCTTNDTEEEEDIEEHVEVRSNIAQTTFWLSN